jgi:hypothetical protein
MPSPDLRYAAMAEAVVLASISLWLERSRSGAKHGGLLLHEGNGTHAHVMAQGQFREQIQSFFALPSNENQQANWV